MTTKRSRAGYEKSTNGCKTCKIRKVKYDETYPECDRCTHTGRRCDGPIPPSRHFTFVAEGRASDRALSAPSESHPAPSSRDLLQAPRGIPQPPLQSIRQPSLLQQPYEERRAFSFFVNVAAPLISGPQDVYLWGQLVPQVAHHSEAVWNAVISIARLWEYPLKDSKNLKQNPDKLSNNQIQALEWYDRAIYMQRTTYESANTIVPMLTCTLFASIELQKCNFINGFTMIRLGFAMVIRFLAINDMTDCSPLASALVHQYMRSACLILTSKLDPGFDVCSFSDVTGAKSIILQLIYALYGLIKEIYYTLRNHGFSEAELACRKSLLTGSLLQLKQKLGHFVESIDRQADSITDTEYLSDYVGAFSVWSGESNRTASIIPETEDQFFSDIIDKARSIVTRLLNAERLHEPRPAFFQDIVLLPPLYLTATMSLNSEIRDQALDLMYRYTSQNYPGQLHGIVAVEDPVCSNGQFIILQRFQNRWDETGKKTEIDTYARIVV